MTNAAATPQSQDFRTTYRCPRGHVTQAYLMYVPEDDTLAGGSAWDYCGSCSHGPNIVQRTQMALDLARQWLEAGLISQEEHHRMASAFCHRSEAVTKRGPSDNYPGHWPRNA